MNCAELTEDSCPVRISDHVLAPSRHASQVSCHRGTQRPSVSHTKRNPTCAPAMGQDYPFTLPSPGVNRPIYPSFPALVSRSLPEGRIPKNHESFFFWMVRSTQFLEVCREMCLLSLITVCVCCVWGGINFSVFEVDSLQEAK